MIDKTKEYIEKNGTEAKLIRMKLLFAPLLIILPIIVSIFLIRDWFYRGFSMEISAYDGELFLGLIILIGNIIFDIPFIKTLKGFSRK